MKTTEKIKRISTKYKFGDFFRNFIAVVLGIIITFAGTDWIAERNTKKDVKKSLQLVKSELLQNREELKCLRDRIVLEQHAANYLFEHKDNPSEMPQDSILKYFPFLFQWSKFTFTNDAIEMLTASTLIQKIQNKDLALQIMKAYGAIKTAENSFDKYSTIKDQIQIEFNENPKVKELSYNLIKQREKARDMEREFEQQLHLLYSQIEGLQLLQAIPNIQSPRIYQASIKEIDEAIAAIDEEYK